MADPDGRVGFSVLINRKKNGDLIVCELQMRVLTHPSLGWSFCVGFQRDLSDEVSIADVLSLAMHENSYASLLTGRECSEANRTSPLNMKHDKAVKYFNFKAGEMWQALTSDALASSKLKSG